MRRWLFVAKNIDCWVKLDKDEITIPVNKPVRSGDKVLIYKSSPHNNLSHIFRVKHDSYKENGKYQMHLYEKITINNPVTLKELKKNYSLNHWQNYFKKNFYEVPLCNWGQIIGSIIQKNPNIVEPFEAEGCYGPHNEGFPLNHKNELLKFIKNIENLDLYSFDEEETKYKIILPLLYHLGWNTYDLRQVFPEYKVRHSTQRVDYLLTNHQSNKLLIEAKKPDVNLDDVKCQLIQYCASKNIYLGILTNGIKWRFYNVDYYGCDLGAIKTWNKDEINLLEDNPEYIFNKLINIFWNGNTCSEGYLYGNKGLKQILSEFKKNHEKSCYNESAVKQVIVLPLLIDLGWNITSEIIFDDLKNGKKIDYVLGNGKNRIFVEVKSLGDDLGVHDILEKHEEHLLRYGDNAGLDFGVLTNGDIWKFYRMKTRDRIKIKITDEDIDTTMYGFIALLSKNNVLSGENIDYLEKKA